MANDDFFEALDRAEAEQGKKILETKQEKRVRYWYEEGYVPGNEKDSDDEDNDANVPVPDDIKGIDPDADEKGSESGDSDVSDTVYGEVKTTMGGARGGHFVRWGGLGGKLALTDAPPGTVAKLDEVLDELLLPSIDQESKGSLREVEAVSETTAIVLSQMPQDAQCWSYKASSCLAIEDVERMEEEYEAARMRYAIEDGEVNLKVRSEEEQTLSTWTKQHDVLKKQAREDFVRSFREEEKKKRSIERGTREQLPGTRRPLPLSQEWQERKSKTGGKKLEPVKASGRSMLPCSMSSGMSSSSSSSQPDGFQGFLQSRLGVGQSESVTVRRPTLQRERAWVTPKALPKRMPDSVLSQPSDGGIEPEFRAPMMRPKFRDQL